jgi:hypothetical protein
MSDPTPTSEIDEQLRETIRRGRRGLVRIVYILAGALFIVIGTCGFLVYQQIGEHARIDQDVTRITSSTCDFYVPLMIAGNQLPTKPASKLGVQLVEGSRQALRGLGCASDLVPPSATLLQLGRLYHVPISR